MSKPIVLLCSRTLTRDEEKALHKYCSVFEFDCDLHQDKTLRNSPYEIVLLDIRSSKNRVYWATNAKDFDVATDTIVWVRSSSQEQSESSLETFKYKYTCKRIRTDAPDKAALINSLKQTHIGTVVSRKRKILNGFLRFLGCLLKS